MNLDINEVLADMLNALKISVKDDWGLVKSTANTFLQNRKSRLELLATMRLSGDIDNDFFLKRLEDENDLLVSELHTIAIINKITAQNAANAAIQVLEKAVETILKI
ncbi:hypothetical protein OX283_009460 [Flavobacterium sp. SUN052]|uniref:hypothetical protein n=1 Tax=Flavobacterium sp. SUN052 TaxID=3002441 RepID=UPI00237E105F|nr:hypothetical protein [Flavobacterium sp. SUN052]MEC4004881.1 hypothetical protein [Flavobacterium sp. SUN052]